MTLQKLKVLFINPFSVFLLVAFSISISTSNKVLNMFLSLFGEEKRIGNKSNKNEKTETKENFIKLKNNKSPTQN